MKRALVLFSFLIVAAGVRIPPCNMTGGMSMDCCPSLTDTAVSNSYASCCQEERTAAPSAAWTKALSAEASAVPLMTMAAISIRASSPVSKIDTLHEISPPKVPSYLSHSALLL